VVEEILYPALEDFQIDIMIGEGPAARSVKLDLPPFTLVGATTRAGMLTNPLRDRFGIVARLEFYTPEELAPSCAARRLLGCADRRGRRGGNRRRSRGTPRIANRLLRRVRDFAEVKADGKPSRRGGRRRADHARRRPLGLDVMDRKLLGAMLEKFGGGPVGVDNLAAAIGEARDTIEDVLEPYLIQQGYLQRTPRGRVALGKHEGWVWKELSGRWIINRHFGDNPHSDVAMPRRHGIDSVHYAGALPTTNELTVSGQGYPVLAQLMRSMRLRNPYERSGQQAALWHLSSQLNIPLLVLGSAMVRQQRESAGLKRILFSARDCYLMSEVFSALFPADPAHYLHVSREVLGSNSPVLRDYLTDAGIAEALVVDLAATGASWHQLSAREQLKVRLFSFVFIDNWVEARVAPQTVTSSPWLDFSWAMKSSGLRAYSAAIEAINSAPHPSCRTIHRAGRFFVPEHHSSNELPDALLQAIIQHQTVLLEQLRKLKGKIAAELAAPVAVPLLATLVESMSQSDLLNSIEKLLRWPPNSGPRLLRRHRRRRHRLLRQLPALSRARPHRSSCATLGHDQNLLHRLRSALGQCEFLKPAKLDDLLTVETAIASAGSRAGDFCPAGPARPRLLLDAKIRVACIDPARGKPIRCRAIHEQLSALTGPRNERNPRPVHHRTDHPRQPGGQAGDAAADAGVADVLVLDLPQGLRDTRRAQQDRQVRARFLERRRPQRAVPERRQ
jgi:hypothetical protein